MILAGDVGATNTRLGLFRRDRESLVPEVIRNYKNRDYASLDAILEEFLPYCGEFERACFGVAGPVFEGKASITNLHWDLDCNLLRARLKTRLVTLINDVEVTGFGLSTLEQDDLLTVNAGREVPAQPAALIAAGTGLGEAILLPRGSTRIPFPTESGHADFAPTNTLQCELLEHLWRRFGHVSWDRVLSGPGLLLIYEFLRDSGKGSEKKEVAERMRNEDASAVMTVTAMNGDCELCVTTLDMFVSLFGAEAGNLALRALARGGVYLCGGIAPKIRQKFVDGNFMKAFVDKGRMRDFLEDIPVYIVLNEQTALRGAALFALREETTSAAAQE